MGEYFTPRHIVKFMVELLDQTFDHNRERFFGKTYFDPTCGTWGFLIEIFKHIKNELRKNKNLNETTEKALKEKTVFGNELNLRSSEIAKMNMILTGDGHSNIDQWDFLTLKDERKNLYDVTIGNPPFGGNREREFVDGFLKDVKIWWYAIFLVPEWVLFKADKNFVEIRRTLVNKGKLLKVISLPQWVFLPYTWVKTDIIFWQKEEQATNYDIEFVDIKNDWYSLDANRKELRNSDLIDYFHDKQKLIDIWQVFMINSSQIYDKIKLNELELEKIKLESNSKEIINKINLLKKQIKSTQDSNEKKQKEDRINEIHLENKKQKENIKKIDDKLKCFDLSLVIGKYKKWSPIQTHFSNVRLWELAEYINGFPFKPSDRAETWKKIIRIQNLNDWEKKFNYYDKNDIDEKYVVRDGDLLISRSATIGFYLWNWWDAYLNQHIFKVIINESKILKDYFYYMGQKIIQEIMKNVHGNTMTHITKWDFENIEIPLPSLTYQQQILSEIEEYQKIINGNRLSLKTYSPKIKIEKKWEQIPLNDVCTLVQSGKTPKYWNSNIQLIKSWQARWYFDFDFSEKYFLDSTFKLDTRKLNIGDVLINSTWVWTAGRVTYFWIEWDFAVDGHITIIRTDKDKLNPKFLVFILWQIYTFAGLEKLATWSWGQIELWLQTIKNLQIPLPSLVEQQEIVTQLEEEQKLIDANKKLIEIFEWNIRTRMEQVWNGK